MSDCWAADDVSDCWTAYLPDERWCWWRGSLENVQVSRSLNVPLILRSTAWQCCTATDEPLAFDTSAHAQARATPSRDLDLTHHSIPYITAITPCPMPAALSTIYHPLFPRHEESIVIVKNWFWKLRVNFPFWSTLSSKKCFLQIIYMQRWRENYCNRFPPYVQQICQLGHYSKRWRIFWTFWRLIYLLFIVNSPKICFITKTALKVLNKFGSEIVQQNLFPLVSLP